MGTTSVAVLPVESTTNCGEPSEAPDGPSIDGDANPWASSRSLHALEGAMP